MSFMSCSSSPYSSLVCCLIFQTGICYHIILLNTVDYSANSFTVSCMLFFLYILYLPAAANGSEVSHIHRNDLSKLQNKVDIYTETSPTVQIWIFPPVTQTLNTANCHVRENRHSTDHHISTEELKSNTHHAVRRRSNLRNTVSNSLQGRCRDEPLSTKGRAL